MKFLYGSGSWDQFTKIKDTDPTDICQQCCGAGPFLSGSGSSLSKISAPAPALTIFLIYLRKSSKGFMVSKKFHASYFFPSTLFLTRKKNDMWIKLKGVVDVFFFFF
jgi:hypothetical protein